jgi:signal transduction histidine kinase/FixJ family two-component response regulator/HPt (histidine-containing phosphotransfer) domain-containing protein
MTSPGLKFSAQPMPQEPTAAPSADSLAAALLESQGYAAFESFGDGAFQLIGPSTKFSDALLGANTTTGNVRLAERMPFLESFLPDAEETWNAGGDGRAESGAWIERVDGGRELALEATAFRLAGRPILLIRNPQKRFEHESELLQTARDAALVHERLIREIQKKEILLHCVIHDLSQPLSAIRGCFSLLGAENHTAKVSELIEIGQRQCRDQEEMIRGILQAFSEEIAAQDANAHDPANAPDVAQIAKQVAQDYAAAFAAKGARIVLDPQMDLAHGWRVAGDAPRLRRVFTNLVENALRYSPVGTAVTLGAVDEDKFVRAYVDDEGPGLPVGAGAPKLFALFAKGKEGGGKAGLGLYFCKMTVERWGGTIGAENRTPHGTRFWFRLPRAAEIAIETPAAAASATTVAAPPDAEAKLKAAGRLRILLADDAPVNRRVTSLLLERQGHEVVAVENGSDALDRLAKERFDAVILDEEMPVMGGLQVVREIRKAESTTGRHLSAILVTGNATDAARQRSRAAGFDAHIAKPFDDDELFHALVDLSRASQRTLVIPVEKPAAGTVELDEQELLRRVGGNPKMLRDVARIFLQDTPKRISAMRKAMAREDAPALATAAHALRGSVAMLGGVDIADALRNVETLGRAGKVADVGKILTSIEGTLSAFEKRIAEIAGTDAAKKAKSGKSGNAAAAGGATRARRKPR